MSRRIYKETTAAAPQGAGASLYHYEGWNLCAEYTATSISSTTTSSITALQRTYTWGPDLSGSMQGAGGVGGLLTIEEKSGPHTGKYFPLYDGNGNVTELIKSGGPTGTTLVAHYEYDPFGNLTQSDDSDGSGYNAVNPWQFSTKYHDQETGFSYYGYRYYDPVTGRWPSRDPIGERGGLNLYGFVMNGGTNAYDFLGLSDRPTCDEFKKEYDKRSGTGGNKPYDSDPDAPNSATDVYEEQGGWLEDAHKEDPHHGPYANSCALRLSLTLNALGKQHKIPPGKGEAPDPNSNNPNDRQIIKAKEMREHLSKEWGDPDYTTPKDSVDSVVSEMNCDCFCLVHASDGHVGFIDSDKIQDSEPIPGKDGKVSFWKLPCTK